MNFIGRKFGRVCSLSVEVAPDASGKSRNIKIPSDGGIQDGLSIEFTINRQSFSATQTGQFRIYGLSQVVRDAIFKDQFDLTQYRAIQFRAGYQSFAPQIFNGTVLQAYSEKQREEVVTVIDAFDGGFPMTNGWTNVATNAGGASGQTAGTVINQLAQTMPGILGPPVVGNFPVANMRGEVLFGNTWGLIRQKSDNQATISDGVVYALQTNEGILNGQVKVLTGLAATDAPSVPLITSDTGLIGAPRRSGLMVEWDMVFEPRLTLFQIVAIQSAFSPKFNGVYKVMGIRHRGIVSKSVGGEAVTTAKFFCGGGSVFEQAGQEAFG